jgi:hypothetical protein
VGVHPPNVPRWRRKEYFFLSEPGAPAGSRLEEVEL